MTYGYKRHGTTTLFAAPKLGNPILFQRVQAYYTIRKMTDIRDWPIATEETES